MTADTSRAVFWQQLYEQGRDGWELGQPAPPLAAWLRSPAAPSPGTALVPGCGRGHEVLLLAEMGHRVTGLDFSDFAVLEAERRARQRGVDELVNIVHADIFEATLRPDWERRFDLAVEHTCYCAIEPEQRDAYAAAMTGVLRVGGVFAGLFWDCGREGGPPWTCSPRELERRFGRSLEIITLEPVTGSVERRRGEEWLMIARRG